MKLINNPELYITKGAVLYIGTIVDTVFHQHHAVQITVSINNEFTIQFENEIFNTGSVIINSNINHKLTGKDSIQALLLIEPESEYGVFFKKHIGKDSYRNIEINNRILETLKNKKEKNFSIISIVRQIALLFEDSVENEIINDSRINEVISLIETVEEKKITVSTLASHVSLSESRLQHLFKSQTGISIKKYLQWKRLIDGIKVIMSGKDFTYSSYESGFADSAHMSRTFKKKFGINLLDIFHNSRSVQVIFCNK